MKRKPTMFIAYCLLLLAFIGCKKDDDGDMSQNPIDQLPPPTQTGENTFGCLVNGEPLSITNSYNMIAIYQGGGVQFGAGGVYFVALDPFEINTSYEFMDIGEGTARAKFTRQIQEGVTCYYEYGDTYEGSVIFSKIDQTNYIISGTFEFSTVTENCENVSITNGRFDMQYTP